MVSIGRGQVGGFTGGNAAQGGYTIKPGDTLWGLAQSLGVTVDDILKLNPHIKDANRIRAGQVLTLPEAAAAEAETEAKAEGEPARAEARPRPPAAANRNAAVKRASAQEALLAQQLAEKVEPGLGEQAMERINREAWKGVVGRDHRLKSKVDLGGFGEARIELDETIGKLGPKDQSMDQKAFTKAAKLEGKQTAWLESGGKISLDTQVGEATNLNAQGDLHFKMTRPYTYDKDDKSSWDVTKKAVKNTYDLPLDHEDARKLERGSRFQLSGSYGGGVGLGVEEVGVSRRRDREVSLDVRRGEGEVVHVRVEQERTRTRGQNAKLSGVGYEGATEDKVREVGDYTLDLSVPAHQKAYDKMIRGDLDAAAGLPGNSPLQEIETTTRTDGVDVQAQLTSFLSADLATKRTNIDPNDARVQRSADRKAFTEAQQAAGKDVRWVQVEAHATPKVGHNVTSPVNAGATGESGFSASQKLSYRALVPQLDGETGTLTPPMRAEDARALPRGAEVQIQGRGEVVGFAGTRFGQEAGAGTPITAGASVGTRHDEAAQSRLGVTVRRLEGEKVQVHLQGGEGRSSSTQFEARVGVDAESYRAFDMEDDNVVTKRLDKELERRLKVEFKAGHKASTSRSQGTTYEIDLSTPGGKAAYERLMRLDGAEANRLDKVQGSGVRITHGRTVRQVQDQDRSELNVLGNRLYLQDALRKDTTTVVRDQRGTTTTDASSFTERSEGLFGRDQAMSWEAVRVRTDEDPKGRTFYRMSYEDKDPRTSTGEMEQAMNLVRELDATPVKPPRIEEAERSFMGRMLGSINRHGETKENLEVFFTPEGIQNMRGHSKEDAMRTYATVVGEREGAPPAWANPKTATEARQILEEYATVKADPLTAIDADNKERLESLQDDYYRLSKRGIDEDAGDYQRARAFSGMVGRMGSEDPNEWSRAFADLGQGVRFEMYDALAAMNRMAGKDEVLVHRFSIKGDAVDVEMTDEGLLRRPKG